MSFYLGLILVLAGAYLLLKNFKLVPGTKTDSSDGKPIEARKIDDLLVRLGSVILCVVGIYLLWPESKEETAKPGSAINSQMQDASRGNMEVWNDELKNLLNKQCIENGKRTAETYPELVTDYCKCATEKISQSMTPAEYTQIMEKPREEQARYMRPVVQTCVDIMTKLIELSEQAKPKREDLNKNQ